MSEDPTGNVVPFSGSKIDPVQDVVRDMGDYAAARVRELAEIARDNGLGEPAALCLVVMSKGGGVVLQGTFVAGPEEGLGPLYMSHAANILAKTAIDDA